ncbi:conserved hypothetical protein [Ricinus communis]|uniref:Uncharacterized protein n=1 Tax=Ricinus communis TaxID=3988 RepID=B9RCM4_RICCO|nr:conserved hypothetical protein [Ricinus communis]
MAWTATRKRGVRVGLFRALISPSLGHAVGLTSKNNLEHAVKSVSASFSRIPVCLSWADPILFWGKEF